MNKYELDNLVESWVELVSTIQKVQRARKSMLEQDQDDLMEEDFVKLVVSLKESMETINSIVSKNI